MSELEELRATARARRNAATRKVARNRRAGVDIAGTEFDPRVSNDRIARLNTKQLNALIGRLDSFMSRKSQFVNLAQGIAPRSEFNEYKKWERKYNKKAVELQKMAEGKETPFGEQNIQENDLIHHSYKFLQNTPDFYRPVDRKSNYFFSRKGLQTLTANMKKRASKVYIHKTAVKIRKNIKAFDNGKKYNTLKLTDEQLILVWQYGGMADAYYEMYTNKEGTYEEDESPDIEAQNNETDEMRTARRRLDRVIDWARKL